jgi:hypothetical protein
MNRLPAAVFVALLAAAQSVDAGARPVDAAAQSGCIGTAEAILGAIRSGQVRQAYGMFDAGLMSHTSLQRFGEVVRELREHLGRMQRYGEARTTTIGARPAAVIQVFFQRGVLEAWTTCDAAGKASDFHFAPAKK